MFLLAGRGGGGRERGENDSMSIWSCFYFEGKDAVKRVHWTNQNPPFWKGRATRYRGRGEIGGVKNGGGL